MDPTEIIKAVSEVATAAAPVAAASIPFTGIVKRMLGPAADELAEMWRDQVRLYRYGRQIKCIEKAEKMAEDAGFTPQAVPPKILFPLLEGASMEDDETLHDMWAALLANAASPKPEKVKPSFITALRQMTYEEAILLEWIYRQESDRIGTALTETEKEAWAYPDYIHTDFLRDTKLDIERDAFRSCLDGLEASQFIRLSDLNEHIRADWNAPPGKDSITTFRGREFLQACSAPRR